MLDSFTVHNSLLIGASPSGKAPDFDSGIPRFDPWRPSHIQGGSSEVRKAGRKVKGFFFRASDLPLYQTIKR